MKIYIVNGYSRVGKDTFLDYVEDRCANRYIVTWSIADIARKMVAQELKDTPTDEQLKSNVKYAYDYRQALIHLTNLFKKTGHIWEVLYKVVDWYRGKADCFFIHCRETTDFEKIKEIADRLGCPVTTIWMKREGIEPFNEQDLEAANYSYDLTVYIPDYKTHPDLYKEVINDFIKYIGGTPK